VHHESRHRRSRHGSRRVHRQPESRRTRPEGRSDVPHSPRRGGECMTGVTLSARDIAEKLGLPQPTAEQVAVIEADLSPALVVAGAGSGKTETMANRIVWLLANGKVRVPEILGLTFTRKAAGELAERVGKRIGQLQDLQREENPSLSIDVLEAPTIATYNSFASGLFRE